MDDLTPSHYNIYNDDASAFTDDYTIDRGSSILNQEGQYIFKEVLESQDHSPLGMSMASEYHFQSQIKRRPTKIKKDKSFSGEIIHV